jgi:hypothetical protein
MSVASWSVFVIFRSTYRMACQSARTHYFSHSISLSHRPVPKVTVRKTNWLVIGVREKKAPGAAWGTLPRAALGLCVCGTELPRPCIKEVVSQLTGALGVEAITGCGSRSARSDLE